MHRMQCEGVEGGFDAKNEKNVIFINEGKEFEGNK